jgi:hypothetical protein
LLFLFAHNLAIVFFHFLSHYDFPCLNNIVFGTNRLEMSIGFEMVGHIFVFSLSSLSFKCCIGVCNRMRSHFLRKSPLETTWWRKGLQFQGREKTKFCSGNHIMWPSCECQHFQMEKESCHREILHANFHEPTASLFCLRVLLQRTTSRIHSALSKQFLSPLPRKRYFLPLRFPLCLFLILSFLLFSQVYQFSSALVWCHFALLSK